MLKAGFDEVATGKKFVRIWIALLIMFTTIMADGDAQATRQGSATKLLVTFKNMVDTSVMQLGNTYHNSFDEEYTIRTFKYYICNISLRQTGGKVSFIKGDHLVNQADSNTTSFFITVPKAAYNSISFLIGVDSIYNVSGIQTGDLDPAKGMFWTWNSGYIMAKLEATSPVSSAPNNNATYHIGGYKTNERASRTITLSIAGSTSPNTNKTINEIEIEVNANLWFNGGHALKIKDNPVCTTPGKLSVQYADNYAGMFTKATLK